MKFSLAVAMIPLSQLVALAKVAEECGFSSITMPDSLFFPERGATGYPYTADGVRMWDAKTPFVDPMIAAAFMGPGTSKIR
ncbi:MAG: LLM class F420-dependent oxidoreductase, partial [Rhodococcus sp.]|nr:LLM class F420-dependent oxidoreductase [Rhodococcus sp. (in: high G+C Gram-positive bacteria)]